MQLEELTFKMPAYAGVRNLRSVKKNLHPDAPRARSWDPGILHAKHREIIRLIVKGLPRDLIAKRTGYRADTIGRLMNSELIQQEVRALSEAQQADAIDIGEEIQKSAVNAVRFNAELITDETASKSLRHGAAKDMLDRAGHGKVLKVETQNSTTYFGKIGIEMLKASARQVRDVTPETEVLTEETS